MTARACEGESLDGHAHQGEVREYVRICVRDHFRRGWLCAACARPLEQRGPAVVTCGECPEEDSQPRCPGAGQRADGRGSSPILRSMSTEFRQLLVRKLAATEDGAPPSLEDVDEVIAATRAELPGDSEANKLLDRLLEVRLALSSPE